MGFASLSRQFHLPLALGVALNLCFAVFVIAMMTTDPFLVVLTEFVLLGDGHATGMALIVFSWFEVVIYRDSIIEHKTLPLPSGLIFRYVFQVFQDTALQMIDLIESLLLEISGRLFTTNAAGAKHRHFLVLG